MAIPVPEPGLVLSYAYVWRLYGGMNTKRAQRKGAKTGHVSSLLRWNRAGKTVVTVAAITHRKPTGTTVGIEIPLRVKAHLGLDAQPSWVIVSEVNAFVWPGYDLRPVPGKQGMAYGFLPPRLAEKIKTTILELIASRRAVVNPRD